MKASELGKPSVVLIFSYARVLNLILHPITKCLCSQNLELLISKFLFLQTQASVQFEAFC